MPHHLEEMSHHGCGCRKISIRCGVVETAAGRLTLPAFTLTVEETVNAASWKVDAALYLTRAELVAGGAA